MTSMLQGYHFLTNCSPKLVRLGQNAVRRFSTSSDEYQYLEKSKIPSLHFQRSLPRLPIPALEETCRRYLNAQRPLLSEEHFRMTESIVRDFQNKEGKALHEELVQQNKRNKSTSYISKPWYDMYLKARDPIVINVNPFIGLNNDPKGPYNTQLIRASNILISSLRFLRSLRSNLLYPEVYHLNPEKSDTQTFRNFIRYVPSRFAWYGAVLWKAFPLDMSQYAKLFNTTRIPALDRDELFHDSNAKHMLVLRNGNFYIFDVLDEQGRIKDPAYIHGCLHQILSDDRSPPEVQVGLGTTMERNSWAYLRQQLLSAGNEKALRLIDSAIFSLSLDDVIMNSDPQVACRVFLHNEGKNRWYDKSVQVIVTKDGQVSINMEHAWGDGVAVLRYINDIFKDSINKPFVHPNSKPASVGSHTVKCLDFKLTPQIKQELHSASEKLNAIVEKLKFDVVQYDDVGKDYIKQQKLSPDAIMQLAFQMAYYKLYKEVGATYESCSTAAYKHGRTETVRSATMATKICSQAFLENNASPQQLRKLMEDCSKLHGSLTKEAAMGKGFDRHLFVLKTLAESKHGKIPEIFQDPSYKLINHIILSTSTLTSPALLFGGFGPVSPDGFGISYQAGDDTLGCLISSYSHLRNGTDLADCIATSFRAIHDVLLKTRGIV